FAAASALAFSSARCWASACCWMRFLIGSKNASAGRFNFAEINLPLIFQLVDRGFQISIVNASGACSRHGLIGVVILLAIVRQYWFFQNVMALGFEAQALGVNFFLQAKCLDSRTGHRGIPLHWSGGGPVELGSPASRVGRPPPSRFVNRGGDEALDTRLARRRQPPSNIDDPKQV
ncbi:MAG: hypothetical protein IPN53_21575, partial [Comamonadaceae bacterium]|nr:hypothetical protein [Comamonadaceae bacterium]